jgi:hypothetical protein
MRERGGGGLLAGKPAKPPPPPPHAYSQGAQREGGYTSHPYTYLRCMQHTGASLRWSLGLFWLNLHILNNPLPGAAGARVDAPKPMRTGQRTVQARSSQL